MRQDIVIGIAVAALLHGGVFLEAVLNPNHPPVRKAAKPPPAIQAIDLPKEEPEDLPKPEPSEETAKPIDIAPAPTIVDAPQIVTDRDFVQRPEPPPPPGFKSDGDLFAVPERHGPRSLQSGPIFDPSKLDQQPLARMRTPPQYPFEMKRNGITGEVTVDFIVDSNGNVQNAYALKSSQREFEQAAVQAVSKWKFKAGRKGGAAVNTHMQVPIVFSLNDD